MFKHQFVRYFIKPEDVIVTPISRRIVHIIYSKFFHVITLAFDVEHSIGWILLPSQPVEIKPLIESVLGPEWIKEVDMLLIVEGN